MPRQEVLILAMTEMLSGICTAGFTKDRDPITGLRWVRPVRDFGTVQAGDMTDLTGQLIHCCDVVELNLVEPRPDPPHVEDWLVDFIHHRPRIVRSMGDEERGRFFPEYLDNAPEQVLIDQRRSLCLVEPARIGALFSLDAYSGKFEARMRFLLDGEANHERTAGPRGTSVTDLKWRELGRSWLGEDGGRLALGHEGLFERLGAEAVYLSVGLSRRWQGEYWPLVVGVHVVPDYGLPAPPARPSAEEAPGWSGPA